MTIIEDIDKLYKKDFKNQIKKNVKWLNDNIDSDDITLKIKNYCEKYDLDFNTVKNKIKTDPIFALGFIKDPSRQNFYETTLLEWIKKLPIIENVRKLPAGGKNAKYLINGRMFNGKDLKDRKNWKSIDFEWDYTFNNKTLKFYASAKYTKLNGGVQDEQFNDLFGFALASLNFENENTRLFAIADGEYYQKTKTYKTDNIEKKITRLEYLNNNASDIFKATQAKDLFNNILEQIKNWLSLNFSKNDIDKETKRITKILKEYKFENNDIKIMSLLTNTKTK